MAKTLSIELGEANDKIKSLQTELAQTNDANTKAASQIDELNQTISTLTAEREGLQVDLAKAMDENRTQAGKVTELEARIAELEAKAKTAEQLAGEALATVGVPPVEQVAQTVPTADELWAQYAQLTDPKAKTEFYNKHRDLLTPKYAQAR